MQPKFTQRNAGFFVRILALTCVLIAMSQVSFAQRKDALWQATSVGPAPVNPEFIGDDIFPTAGNPVSRAWCYNNGAATARLNRQSLLNTTLTPIGARRMGLAVLNA